MAVDLKNNTLFQRLSVVLEPDCLIKLEHQMTKDRIRKTMFDRVSQVTVWRQLPWVRIVFVAIFLCFPGLLMLGLAEEILLKIIGLLILGIGGFVDGWYIFCRKTTLRVVSPGKTEEITGVFLPGRVRRLVSKMADNIRTVQAVAVPPPFAPPVLTGLERQDLSPSEPSGSIGL